MEHIYTVSFFGHRIVNNWNVVEEKLEQVIRSIIEHHNGVVFLFERDGDFDQMVSSTVRRLKNKTDRYDLSLVWVLPYIKADYIKNYHEFSQYYDEIEVCEQSSAIHPKAAFLKRNQTMIDRSDLIIFYVEHTKGGAYQAYKYAVLKNKNYIKI